jgi:hypothetical protein
MTQSVSIRLDHHGRCNPVFERHGHAMMARQGLCCSSSSHLSWRAACVCVGSCTSAVAAGPCLWILVAGRLNLQMHESSEALPVASSPANVFSWGYDLNQIPHMCSSVHPTLLQGTLGLCV